MALGTPTDGGAAYSAANGTSVAPTYPTGIGANDVLVLIIGQRPSTANSGTVTTPSGWTLRDSKSGGGYGTTLLTDQANTNLYFYTKDTVSGSESGTLSVTVGTNNICWGLIVLVPNDSSSASYGTADGERTTAPTQNVAFTDTLTDGATATNFESGDMAIFGMNIATDNGANSFSAPTISASGATFGLRSNSKSLILAEDKILPLMLLMRL